MTTANSIMLREIRISEFVADMSTSSRPRTA